MRHHAGRMAVFLTAAFPSMKIRIHSRPGARQTLSVGTRAPFVNRRSHSPRRVTTGRSVAFHTGGEHAMGVNHTAIACLALLAMSSAPATAQPYAAAPLTFEVASVKPSGAGGSRGGCHGVDAATRTGPDEAP